MYVSHFTTTAPHIYEPGFTRDVGDATVEQTQRMTRSELERQTCADFSATGRLRRGYGIKWTPSQTPSRQYSKSPAKTTRMIRKRTVSYVESGGCLGSESPIART